MTTDTEGPRPDRVTLYVDAEGQVRWNRRDGGNNEITADSGQGYTDVNFAAAMADEVNGGNYVLVFDALPANRQPSYKQGDGRDSL
jgi:hypothetical protein